MIRPFCKADECRAPVRFVRAESGRTMVLDWWPTPDGRIIPMHRLDGAVVAHVLRDGEEPPAPNWPRFTDHHATRPAAGRFRRGGAR